MKFNKAKLAALATSVFMGVAMLAGTAFASEAAATPGEGTAITYDEAQRITGYAVDWESLEWYPSADGSTCTVDYMLKNDKGGTYWVIGAEAKQVQVEEATCTETKKIYYQVTLLGETKQSDGIQSYINEDGEEVLFGKALGHDFKEIDRIVEKQPTCTEAGDGYVVLKCERCGLVLDKDDEGTSIKDQLEAFGHDWGPVQSKFVAVTNIKTDSKGNVVVGSDGIPELEDITKDGVYQIQKWQECQRVKTHEPKVVTDAETNEVDAEGKVTETVKNYEILAKKGVIAMITAEKNIAEKNSLVGKYKWTDLKNVPAKLADYPNMPAENTIELEDCTKDAEVTITFYTAEMKPVSQMKYTIKAHHMPMPAQVEFDNQYDMDDALVTYNEKDGTYTIKNKSCYRTITYYEVIHCSAEGCPNKECNLPKQTVYTPANGQDHRSEHMISRVKKEKTPDGEHIINTKVWDEIAALDQPADYDEIVEKYGWTEDPQLRIDEKTTLGTHEDTYILISENTATCTEDGEAKIQFVCKICKQVIKEQVVKTKALGHIALPAVGENIVNPTCTSQGSYDAVIYCERCHEVLYKREGVKIPRLAHTNEIGVTQNEKGEDITKGIDENYTATAKYVLSGHVVVDYDGEIYKAWLNREKDPKKFEDLCTGKFIGTKAGEHGYAQSYGVSAKVVTTCAICGGNEQVLDPEAKLTVTYVEPSDTTSKKAGEIKLQVESGKWLNKEGKTVPGVNPDRIDYYTSINEYQVGSDKSDERPAQDNPTPVEPVAPEQLPAVENLKAATAGMNKVTLTWDAVEGANGYLILKNGTQIAYTTGATTYTDKNASSENFEFYWVLPYQTVNGKNYKGELSNYVWGIGRVVGQVQKVTATGTEGAVELSWNAVSGANGYVILSKTGSNTAAFNAPVEVTGTSATVNAEAGKVQFYWVYATYTNADGNKVAAGKCSPFAWAIAE